MQALIKKLAGTDHRSIGKVDEVVADVLAEPARFGILLDGMLHDNSVIRMRCADAVEKITAKHPEYLTPYKGILLEQVARVDQQEVRWHVAQLFSRIEWDACQRSRVKDILWTYLEDDSRIVKTFTMQALADLAMIDARFRKPVLRKLEELTRTGSPAMQNRGRKLLKKLAEMEDTG